LPARQREAVVLRHYLGLTEEQAAQTMKVTRGTIKSVFDTHDGTRHYVRLKVGPGYGTPFSIWTFRVGDPVALTQFPVGSGVAFFARHIDGENTIVAMQVARKMERYSVR